ncbi:MAG: hypothetical protein Q9195_006900 [Heterodermia aff. obscurata]
MMVNVEVYAMADKFNILPLKDYAHANFQLLTHFIDWEWFSDVGLVNVFLKAIQSTPSNDIGIRKIIVDICASNMDTIMGSRGNPEDREKFELTRAMWEPVLKEDQDFQYDVLRKSARENSQRLTKSTDFWTSRQHFDTWAYLQQDEVDEAHERH